MLQSCLNQGTIEAGCDEAGRGCLAGPVFAAAVILPVNYANPLLNDSKKLSEKKRNHLRQDIERNALDWAVASIDNHEIDILNILRSSIKAMHKALDLLKLRPEHILVDGNHFFRYNTVLHRCIIRGDGTYASIAAASVLAKTHRDEYMRMLHEDYQQYGWDRNKGYGTLSHRSAIKRYGISPYHRRSFALFERQQMLDLT